MSDPTLDLPVSDLQILEQQEELLRFDRFDADRAWQLGLLLREAALAALGVLPAQSPGDARPLGCSAQIELGGQLLFAFATNGAAPTQSNWIRRKRNSVLHFGQSSYRIGQTLERDGMTLQARDGLALEDFAAHGGGFPLWVADRVAGTVVFSGLPQRDDHALVVDCLARLLQRDVPRLPLSRKEPAVRSVH